MTWCDFKCKESFILASTVVWAAQMNEERRQKERKWNWVCGFKIGVPWKLHFFRMTQMHTKKMSLFLCACDATHDENRTYNRSFFLFDQNEFCVIECFFIQLFDIEKEEAKREKKVLWPVTIISPEKKSNRIIQCEEKSKRESFLLIF